MRYLLKRVGLFIGVSLLALIVAECSLRILHPQEVVALTRDRHLGWRLRTNVNGVWRREVRNDKGFVRFRTNSMGLRESHINSDAKTVVWLCGDSFIVAANVEESETAAEILESSLGDAAEAEVINLGVQGHGPIHSYYYLREKLNATEIPAPDVVIYSFYVYNDFHDSYGPLSTPSKRTALIDDTGKITEVAPREIGVMRKLFVFLGQHFHIIRFIRYNLIPEENIDVQNFLRNQGVLSARLHFGGLTESDSNSMQEIAAHYLMGMRDMAERHGARFLISFIGTRALGQDQRLADYRLNRLKKRLQESAADFVDFDSWVSNTSNITNVYVGRRGHFSVEGNRVYSEFLLEQLRDESTSRIDQRIAQ